MSQLQASGGCAPCLFGAVTSSLLTYPIGVNTAQVSIVPVITVVGNGTLSTAFQTTTLTASATYTDSLPVVTSTYRDASQLTWTVSGLTLTYPTTYVDYKAFAGAAASDGACAQTVRPSSIELPSNTSSASLILPIHDDAALYSYLDSLGLQAQLGYNDVNSCASLAQPMAVSASTTSGSTTSRITSKPTLTTALLFNTITGNPIVIDGKLTTSLAAAQVFSVGKSVAVSATAQSVSGVFTAQMTASRTVRVATTSSTAVYRGDARSRNEGWPLLLGVLLVACVRV